MKRIIVIMLLNILFASIITAQLIINKKTESFLSSAKSQNKKVAEINSSQNVKPREKIVLYEKVNKNIEDDVTGVSKGDIFYSNALIWNKEHYEDDKYYGYYYQIDGLKNKEVQQLVNNKLLDSALEYCKNVSIIDDEYFPLAYYLDGKTKYYSKYYDSYEEVKNGNAKIYFNQLVLSSFSNVICVATTGVHENRPGYFGSDYYEYRYMDNYLNIDLNTGNDLKFSSLFTYNTDIIGMLNHLLYSRKSVKDVPWTEDYFDFYYDEENESKEKEIENNDLKVDGPELLEMEKIIKRYEYSNNVKFGFMPNQFFIHLDDCFCIKNYSEQADYYSNKNEENIFNDIAIFKRFLSDVSLYEDDSLSTELIVGSYYDVRNEGDEYDRVYPIEDRMIFI